jgi:TDG/mug DNA glycosylase family protein
MKEGVKPLLQKLCTYKPKFVCIIGKTIWNAISAVIENDLELKLPPVPTDIKLEEGLTEGQSTPKKKRRKSTKKVFAFGLQPYKLVHGEGAGYTLFWAVPSTSGKVASYQVSQSALHCHGY